MPKEKSIIPIERIAAQIYLIRGEQVMLDSDLAELYGVPTKLLNEQVSLAQPVLRFNSIPWPLDRYDYPDASQWGAGSLCVAPKIRSSAGGPLEPAPAYRIRWSFGRDEDEMPGI